MKSKREAGEGGMFIRQYVSFFYLNAMLHISFQAVLKRGSQSKTTRKWRSILKRGDA